MKRTPAFQIQRAFWPAVHPGPRESLHSHHAPDIRILSNCATHWHEYETFLAALSSGRASKRQWWKEEEASGGRALGSIPRFSSVCWKIEASLRDFSAAGLR